MRKNNLIKILLFFILCFLIIFSFGCKKNNIEEQVKQSERRDNIVQSVFEKKETEAEDVFDFEGNYKNKKSVVVYFSCTGNTKSVAEKIAEIFDCQTIEIEPEVPYTNEDLNYRDKFSRVSRENLFDPFTVGEEETEELVNGTKAYKEKKDDDIEKVSELPKIKKINVDKYNVVFLGYPIWFGEAPKVLYTFIKETKLKNKTIIPFCTSGSSDIGYSDQNLANFASEDVYFMSGKRWSIDATIEDIKKWVISLGPDLDVK